MYEPTPGIKENMKQLITSIPTDIQKAPIEFTTLAIVMAWLHAVIQERLRYFPTGFSKFYEFNDADFQIALKVIKEWMILKAEGRSNISPSKIPWTAIKYLVKDTIYGGKVDVESDQHIIDSLVDKYLVEGIYSRNFVLVSKDGNSNEIQLPESKDMHGYQNWLRGMLDQQTPHWIGLSKDADKELQIQKGMKMFEKIRKFESLIFNK